MSCFKPDDLVLDEYSVHPLADQMKEFETLSPWILVDGYCAMRHINDLKMIRVPVDDLNNLLGEYR